MTPGAARPGAPHPDTPDARAHEPGSPHSAPGPEALRARPAPPGDPALAALWHIARNDWHAAHEAAQSDPGPAAAWVHAHLHRIEGDLPNARYWYARANRPEATTPLDTEWSTIATTLTTPG